jgi:hypothetical protein
MMNTKAKTVLALPGGAEQWDGVRWATSFSLQVAARCGNVLQSWSDDTYSLSIRPRCRSLRHVVYCFYPR